MNQLIYTPCQLIAYFLKVDIIGFGGLGALVSYMQSGVVIKNGL